MIRLLVCGGRNYADKATVYRALDRVHAKRGVALVIHGAATGADTLAGEWAADRGIPVAEFPADWAAHGDSAGPIRNARMLAEEKPDAVVAFAGGTGTAHMVRIARASGVPVWLAP